MLWIGMRDKNNFLNFSYNIFILYSTVKPLTILIKIQKIGNLFAILYVLYDIRIIQVVSNTKYKSDYEK